MDPLRKNTNSSAFNGPISFWSAEILQDKAEGSKDGDGVVTYSELSASTDNAVLRNLCDQKCQRLAIFPARLQASIFASTELNFCVRNGNRWTLCEKTLTNLTIVKVKGMSLRNRNSNNLKLSSVAVALTYSQATKEVQALGLLVSVS